MADFIVKSGIQLSGNISGTNYLFANSIVVSYDGSFSNVFVSGKIVGNVVGTVSSIDNFTTSALKEGSNLYFTPQRVIAALVGNNVTVNNLTVAGDLEVQGNVVTLNTGTLVVEDKNIVLANGAVNAAQADGAGITISGANATILYVTAKDEIQINKSVNVQANLNVTGTATITGNVNVTNSLTIGGQPVVTYDPLNQSIAILRAQLEAPVSNVLYVSKSGNDNNSGNSLSNALANIHVALNKATPWTTVFVKSGEYTLYQQPVTIKQRVGLVGDNLRTTTIRPSNVTQDMFYVNNASYVTGFTFRDHLAPAAVFSFNPDGSAGTIVTSPYIQNSSSITTTGTGMRVDGNYVSGLRSMVCDSYTQTNAGGIGIHMLNRGYTQLVSVFTICCNIAILAENGGFCSITNSNSSFGNYGLVARGVSEPTAFGYVNGDQTGQQFVLYGMSRRPNYRDAILFANYNQAKCSRDTGLIADSLAIDLAYSSNTQSTFAGLQYWSQTSSAIQNEQPQTIAAINFAKNLSANVVANVTIGNLYQGNITQIRGAAGTYGANVVTEFDLIANIITGGTVGVTDRIIPNGLAVSNSANINNTANLLSLNKTFIAAETVAYVRQTYPGFFGNASYFMDPANAEATCSRDVGYMIDSINFDLLHGGNRQAIMSGVYYYNYSTDTSQINDQIVATGKSYDYIGSLVSNIVRNIAVTKTYQTAITQNTTAATAATSAEANAVLNNVSLIKNIITNGPTVAPPKRPINSSVTVTTNLSNAAKIILANRDFIVAETVAYVNQNWANIAGNAATFYTVASSSNLVGNSCTVTILENIQTTILSNSAVTLHSPSYIQTSTHTFEYIGSGTDLATALPYNGGFPIQGNEVQESGGGAVYFTSTDQQGDFRIGKELLFNRVDGTITGRTFNKSLFAVMTPYILAIEG